MSYTAVCPSGSGGSAGLDLRLRLRRRHVLLRGGGRELLRGRTGRPARSDRNRRFDEMLRRDRHGGYAGGIECYCAGPSVPEGRGIGRIARDGIVRSFDRARNIRRARHYELVLDQRDPRRADQPACAETRMGGESGVEDPGGRHGDGRDQCACGGHGPEAEEDAVSKKPDSPATYAVTRSATIEASDVIERRGRIRHRLRYSDLNAYTDAVAGRASESARRLE